MDDPWTIKRLLDGMRRRGAAPAVTAVTEAGIVSWSRQELAEQAERLAAGLTGTGLRRQEPVAIWAPNSPDWIVAGLAVSAAGGVLLPVDDLTGDDEATGAIAFGGCTRVFTVRKHLAALRAWAGGGGRQLILLDGADDAEDADDAADGVSHWRDVATDPGTPLSDLDPDAPALLVFTSGTTGRPKAFHLTSRNIATNVEAVAASEIVLAGDRALLPLPFHHAYPWIIGILTALTAEVTVVLPEAVTAPQLVHAMRAGEVTVMVGVPRLYEALMTGLDARLSARSAVLGRIATGLRDASFWCHDRLGIHPGKLLFAPVRRQIGPKLRLMVSGGARLEPRTIRKIKGLGWEILTGYGLAETASIFTFNTPTAQRVGSEGRPATPDSKIRIADPDDNGVGEIQVTGPSVFSGYLDNPEANAAAFTEDGWFRTGDRGRLEGGFVIVLGRLKELIVLSGGKNIDPEALEKAYGAHPHIAEIGVMEREGSLVALVRPDLAAIRADNVTRIDDAIRVALGSVGRKRPPYQRLAGFAITREPLPRTRLMKLRRFMLPDLYERARAGEEPGPEEEMSAEDRALLEASPAREVWALLQENHPNRRLSLETSPQLDLGMDSFAWMSFVAELEERAGVRLDDDAIGRIETLRDLIREAGEAEAAPAATSDEAVDDLLRPPGPVLRGIGFAVFAFGKMVMRTVFRLRVEGTDRLPDSGPVLLTPNHLSDLDPVALAASLPFDRLARTWWAADLARLQATWPGRKLCRAGRVYPVDERSPATALAAAGRVLAEGRTQVWFPEAWRSPDGALQRFLPGVGKLLAESRAAAVPVLIEGTFEAMPRDRRWPRPHPVRVVYGEPVPFDALRAEAGADDDYEGLAAALRERVAALARTAGLPAAKAAE